MLIKSDFKDYYDFIQGKYGVDIKVVYERVQETKKYGGSWGKIGMHVPGHKLSPYTFVRIAFCGLMYPIWHINGIMHTAYDAAYLHKSKIPEGYGSTHSSTLQFRDEWKKKTDVNEKENCPIVLLEWTGGNVKNVKLSDYSFGRLVEPEDAYRRIYDFLIREPVIKDNRTDLEKVVSAGFDKKTSFRNM